MHIANEKEIERIKSRKLFDVVSATHRMMAAEEISESSVILWEIQIDKGNVRKYLFRSVLNGVTVAQYEGKYYIVPVESEPVNIIKEEPSLSTISIINDQLKKLDAENDDVEVVEEIQEKPEIINPVKIDEKRALEIEALNDISSSEMEVVTDVNSFHIEEPKSKTAVATGRSLIESISESAVIPGVNAYITTRKKSKENREQPKPAKIKNIVEPKPDSGYDIFDGGKF